MGFLDNLDHLMAHELCENIQILELCENIQILDVLTKLYFWPFWPLKWPLRSMMTLNLKLVAFVPYVSLFSVICIVVLATFGTIQRLTARK